MWQGGNGKGQGDDGFALKTRGEAVLSGCEKWALRGQKKKELFLTSRCLACDRLIEDKVMERVRRVMGGSKGSRMLNHFWLLVCLL